jgi:hypothetical protein
MNYDFVEIGTCDYHTLLESCNQDQVGLSVEPIKVYLDRLPNKPNVTKVNLAITSEDKIVDLFWVDPQNQEKHNLGFTKGWGTIITPHKGHTQAEKMLEDGVLSKHEIEAVTWETLCKRYNIDSVTFVKIDAEGHDCVIVNSVLDGEVKPEKISFETTHCPQDFLETTVKRLIVEGYKQTETGEDFVFVKVIYV